VGFDERLCVVKLGIAAGPSLNAVEIPAMLGGPKISAPVARRSGTEPISPAVAAQAIWDSADEFVVK
jgi:hypothetical protein